MTLLFTAVVVESVRQRGSKEHLRLEKGLGGDIRDAIERRFDVNIALLSSVVGLFDASQTVERQEFEQFFRRVAGTAGNLSGIQGIGFARFVPADRLAPFLDEMRAEGRNDFRIFPEGRRQIYTAIEYLQPNDWRNERAVGYDMYSNSVRREAMQRAVLTGRPSLSARVTLLQEDSEDIQAGVLIYLPVFRDDNPVRVKDVASRVRDGEAEFRDLLGWAYSPLRMTDVVKAAMTTVTNPNLKAATFALFDGSNANSSNLLFSQIPQRSVINQADQPGYSVLRDGSFSTFRVGGRTLLLGVQLGQTSGWLWGLDANVWITLAFGLVASSAISGITWLLVRNHRLVLNQLKISQALNQERALAATVFEQSSYGISITDPEARVVACNEAYCQLTGYGRHELLGRNLSLLHSDRHDHAFYRQLWDHLRQRDHWEGEIWNRLRNGDVRRHELTIKAVRNGDGKLINYVGMLHDVSDRYQQEAEVRYQARHDYLTGLPNRAELIVQMDQALARAKRYGVRVALVFLDLDGFKPINDQLGHATGDLVLQTVAKRLQVVIRESDTLARQGGDEFVLLIPQASDQNGLMTLAHKLQEQVESPIPELEGLPLSVSMGIALFPDHAASAEELLHLADAAMYQAKQQRQGSSGHVAIATPNSEEAMASQSSA
ncbi:CHASE domain-containing protein [Synechococcus sp. CS-1328]|uniref:CHASE domain-containing protein n=1 Tax=Synechococcus sp. CS-1328 TaxID=2847976 RepID=UPI00223BAC2B|nr:CHASE domain-containing protein [Synechococcus sp. CS-1328]